MLRVRVLEQKFYSELRNGSAFNLNPSDFTTYLAGCVGERIRAITTIDVAWWTSATNSNPLVFSGNQITRSSGSFLTDGFAVGDIIFVDFPFPTGDQNKTITYVDATTIIVNTSFGSASGTYTSGTIYGRTPLEGLLFDYGLIENNENTNFDSKIDSSLQSFYGGGIVSAGGTPVQLTPTNNGIQDVWQNGQVTCSFEGLSPSGNTQYFEIIHDFIILPYYKDGYLPNLQNNSLPLLFAGGNTLKYVLRANFRDQVANPNSNKQVVLDNVLGSVGFFDQNFNGFNNDYFITNVGYVGFDGIAVQAVTEINFTVNSASGNFTGGEDFLMGVSYLAESPDFVPTENYEDNFLYDIVRQQVGVPAVAGNIIFDLSASLVSPTQIDVTLKTQYNGSQQAKIDDTKYYAIWIEIGQDALPNAADDRVPLLVDVENYDYDADVAGLVNIRPSESFLYPHPVDCTASGYSDIKGWIEDGYVWKLSPVKLNLTLEAEIIDAAFILGAANSVTGDFFELQRYDFDIQNNSVLVPITVFGTPYTAQVIEIDTTRGFILADQDQFNFVKWSSLGAFGDNQYAHEIKIGFKLNWEEWIGNPNVPPIFYDNTQFNNGFNQLSSRYSLEQGYAIVCRLDLNVGDVSGATTNYVFETPDSVVEYYDEDGTEKPEWCCQITTTNQAESVNLNGNYLTSENTKIRARFRKCDGSAFGVIDGSICGVVRLDIENGGLYTIEELSTFRPYPAGQKLIPLQGETQTEIRIDPSNTYIDLWAEVDKDLIVAGARYCASARIWFTEGAIEGDILTEDGDLIVTEEVVVRPIKLETA